jgi:hypothetical protein
MHILKIGSVLLFHNNYVIITFSKAPLFKADSSLLSKHVNIYGIHCFIVELTKTRDRSLKFTSSHLILFLVIISLILTIHFFSKVLQTKCFTRVFCFAIYTTLQVEVNVLSLFQVSHGGNSFGAEMWISNR